MTIARSLAKVIQRRVERVTDERALIVDMQPFLAADRHFLARQSKKTEAASHTEEG